MLINGTKNETGLFVYDENAVYQKNDMVIEGGTIYICKPEENSEDIDESSISDSSISISNQRPSQSSNFVPYLSSLMSNSIEEWKNFLESNGTTEDKYINLKSLPAILNMYQLGTYGKGVIGSSILYDKYGEEPYIYNIGNTDSEANEVFQLNKFENYNTILGELMTSDDVNNAVIRVSRDLPELASLGLTLNDVKAFIDPDDDSILDLDKTSCVLRQYSYIDDNGNLNRVQEIVDHIDNSIFFRSAVKTEDKLWSDPGNFKTASMTDRGVKARLNNILSIYQAKLRSLDELKSKLTKNFRFKSIGLNSSNSNIDIMGKDEISINSYDWTVNQNSNFSSYKSLGYAKTENLVTADTNYFQKDSSLNDNPTELQLNIFGLASGKEVSDLTDSNSRIIISFNLDFEDYSNGMYLEVRIPGRSDVERIEESGFYAYEVKPSEVFNSNYKPENGLYLSFAGYYKTPSGDWTNDPMTDEIGGSYYPTNVDIKITDLQVFLITNISINKSSSNTYIGIPSDTAAYVDDDINDLGMVTVILEGSDGGDIKTSDSVTFSPSDLDDGESVTYRVGSSGSLNITKNSSKLSLIANSNVIKNIYYQKYY